MKSYDGYARFIERIWARIHQREYLEYILALAWADNDTDEEFLVEHLIKQGMIKQGSFTLKSGKETDIYVDLRELISDHHWLEIFAQSIRSLSFDPRVVYDPEEMFWLVDHCDLICGVPYGAIPLATLISPMERIPQILLRKEPKEHGSGRQVDGKYEAGQTVFLVEDVVSTGSSVVEAVKVLADHGLKVTNVVSVVDREDGAPQKFKELGIAYGALMTLSDIRRVLNNH